MSKIFESQVVKAKTLAEGMKRHRDEINALGVREDVLNSLISACGEAQRLNHETERLQMAASEKRHEANAVLIDVKRKYNDLRAIIRRHVPAEQWSTFGLMDKR